MKVAHLMLVGGLTVFAQPGMTAAQAPRSQPTAAAPGSPLVRAGKNPFAGIFKSRRPRPDMRLRSSGPDAAGNRPPYVVCGMVVVPVDPSGDPKMVVQAKPGAAADDKMPRISPKTCGE